MARGRPRMPFVDHPLNQQRVCGLVQLIHLEPTPGDGNAIIHIAGGTRILPQFLVGGNDLTTDMFARGHNPFIEIGGVRQGKVGEKVAVIGIEGVLEGFGFVSRVDLLNAGQGVQQNGRINFLPTLWRQGQRMARNDQHITHLFTQASQGGA